MLFKYFNSFFFINSNKKNKSKITINRLITPDPRKINADVTPLNLTSIKSLNFENVDEKVFRSIQLSRDAIKNDHSSVISLNAANEIAVDAFLNKKINFNTIVNIIEMTILKNISSKINNLDDVVMVDEEARKISHDIINSGKYK